MSHGSRRWDKGWLGLLLFAMLLTVALVAASPGVAYADTTGSIGGTVTDQSSNALAAISVSVYPQDYAGGPATGTAYTAADGTYTIDDLAPGSYWVEFCDSTGTYASQIWDDHDLGTGSMDYVTVTAGDTTSGIDASLQIAGKISGTVTDGNGIPLTTVWACVYVNGAGGYFADHPASVDGTYTIGGLAPGSYNVEFIDFDSKYASQWFNDQADQSGAAVITVSSGNTVSAVDAVMAPLPGAVIGPVDAVAPAVSGTAVLGDLLRCTNGTWSSQPAPTYTYQWLRNGVPITGTLGDTYRVRRADCGQTLTCQVTASNSGGGGLAASAALKIHAAPAVGLAGSPRTVTAGARVTISGTVRNSLVASRTVCLCRRLYGRLIVLRRFRLTSTGTFRCTWSSRRGGLWRFVATYEAAGCRFASPAVSVVVRKK
jgi:hypothetical protein